jgi:simple sugar transport system substrate-binding protein
MTVAGADSRWGSRWRTQEDSSGCLEKAGMRTERIRLLIVTHDLLGDPFWAILLRGVAEGAQDTGCDTDHYRPEVFTPSKMRAVVERALARHPDGLITTLPDPEALDRTLRTAIKDGLPVIILNTFDRRPAEARLPALCSIGADDVEGGRRAAEKILECGPSRGALCVDHYKERNTCHEQRAAGFTQRMTEARAPVDHLAVDGSDPELAMEAVAQRLDNKDRPIDAVVSLGPPGWAFVDAALVTTGLTGQIRHVTFDVTDDVLNAIGKGGTLATIDCQQFLQGYLGVVLMNAYLRHDVSPCGEIMTGPRIIDLATLSRARERFAAGVVRGRIGT